MREYAEKLAVKIQLLHAVVIIQTGICTPAQMEGTMYMRLGPLHDLADLIPVGSFLTRHIV